MEHCTICGDVDMSPEAQGMRRIVLGTPVWMDKGSAGSIQPMTPEEKKKAYASCPYHLNGDFV